MSSIAGKQQQDRVETPMQAARGERQDEVLFSPIGRVLFSPIYEPA